MKLITAISYHKLINLEFFNFFHSLVFFLSNVLSCMVNVVNFV